MKKAKLLSVFIILTFVVAFAQNESDALRYSRHFYGGTARSTSIGGATSALGADFSALSINPAGIGVNRESVFLITPSVMSSNTNSVYIDNSERDMKTNFNFGNMGIIYASTSEGRPWRAVNFGFGYNRLNNFHQSTYYSGYNLDNSLLDAYLEDVNAGAGVAPVDMSSYDLFGVSLAWENFMINPVDTSLGAETAQKYNSVIPNGNVRQSRSKITRGAIDDYFFAVGGNYYDKLYVGASLGFPYLKYREESYYLEHDETDQINGFRDFSLDEEIITTGRGINFKMGAIYKLNEQIRVSGAIHSPTYYAMRDEYTSIMNTNLEDTSGSVSNYYYESPNGEYNYRMTTPWRANTGLAFVLNRFGFFSFDYEYVDYRAASYNFSTGDSEEQVVEQAINNNMNSIYTSAHNVRAGIEVKVEDIRIRGGYALYGNSFEKSLAVNNSTRIISGGLGYSKDDFFIDVAYSRGLSENYFQLYALNNTGTVNNGVNEKVVNSNFLATFGFKF